MRIPLRKWQFVPRSQSDESRAGCKLPIPFVRTDCRRSANYCRGVTVGCRPIETAIAGVQIMSSTLRLTTAIDRIKFSRQYTKRFLAGLSDEEWFWCPSELTTHIAWQVGHVAVSQYNLCLRRVRGRTTADETLIPDRFIEVFKLGSTPDPVPANNPTLAEIRRVFDAVEQQVVTELATQQRCGAGSARRTTAPRVQNQARSRRIRAPTRARSRRPNRNAAPHDGQAAASLSLGPFGTSLPAGRQPGKIPKQVLGKLPYAAIIGENERAYTKCARPEAHTGRRPCPR